MFRWWRVSRGMRMGRSRRAETREFETFVDDLERLRDWLVAEGMTHVAMEATGIYWKPVWFVLEEAELELDLVNSRNMRMVPGRKTDVSDAGWIAQLLEVGLLRGSFVPPPLMPSSLPTGTFTPIGATSTTSGPTGGTDGAGRATKPNG